ncbi:MAG: hypothetical protein HQL54_13685 [Magnetococcales bacterium]|nr:hypothetical protein [Magnetococcales bacterium]
MEVSVDGALVDLPDFMIIGAPRCGTTALAYFLSQVSGIALSSPKEPGFFLYNGVGPLVRRIVGESVRHGMSWRDYSALFSGMPEGVVKGEATTWYLRGGLETIVNIEKIYGARARDVRIIVVLRDPIARAWSHYQMARRNGSEDRPAELALTEDEISRCLLAGYSPAYDYLGFGVYQKPLRLFRDHFNHVHVIDFAALQADFSAVVLDVLRFLSVDGDVDMDTSQRLNASGTPKGILAGLGHGLIFNPGPIQRMIRPLVTPRIRALIRWQFERFIPRKAPSMPDGLRARLSDYYSGFV